MGLSEITIQIRLLPNLFTFQKISKPVTKDHDCP